MIGAIDKLQRLGGCILADSVGLGETFDALAVVKYHELRDARVLVLASWRATGPAMCCPRADTPEN